MTFIHLADDFIQSKHFSEDTLLTDVSFVSVAVIPFLLEQLVLNHQCVDYLFTSHFPEKGSQISLRHFKNGCVVHLVSCYQQ